MNEAPSLNEKEIGHLRHMARLANLLPGDWSGMGSDWWDIGEGAQQYELAFMVYTLGIVQHRFTPAYHDFCRDTIAALIAKMMVPDIWQKWINASRGGKIVDPDQQELGPGWIDPLKKHNIMFKGHLLQMAALHEALYRTGKYAKPGAFTFEFRATTWGDGNETYAYNLPELARIVHNEYVESGYEGVQCEPNRVYPMCNQHAVLGLIHCDQVLGTGYSADVMPKFKAAWQRKGYTSLETGSHMRMRWVRQDQVHPSQVPWADGWTGIFMHAWDPGFIEQLYPRQRETHLAGLLAGKEGARVCCAMVPTSAKIGFGMFTALAAEVGDRDGRDRLLDYADRNFGPRWTDGAFHFPRSDDWMPDEHGNSHGVDVLSGNALLPMARINAGSGLWSLYNEPWSDAARAAPRFTGIDCDVAGVARATCDAHADTLHLSLIAGPRAGQTSFSVQGLDPARRYVVRRGDTSVATLRHGTDSDAATWNRDGLATVRIDARESASFVIAPVH
jgi:hypothetical protein